MSWVYPLLVLAAAGFTAPAGFAFGNPAVRRFGKITAITGLFLLAYTLMAVKDRSGLGKIYVNDEFAVARNGASLAFALIPLALAATRSGRFERIGMIVVGLGGGTLLAALLGVEGPLWMNSESGQPRFYPGRIPGASSLIGHGELRVGWWLLLLGSLLATVPLLVDAWGAARRRPRREALTPYLLGAGLMTLAMAVLFWHQSDWNHRATAYNHISLLPIGATLLAWVNGRLPTARFSLRVLSGFGAAIAIWILAGGGFEGDSQSITSIATLLHGFFLLVLPLLLLIDGILLLASRRGSAPAQRSRTSFK